MMVPGNQSESVGMPWGDMFPSSPFLICLTRPRPMPIGYLPGPSKDVGSEDTVSNNCCKIVSVISLANS